MHPSTSILPVLFFSSAVRAATYYYLEVLNEADPEVNGPLSEYGEIIGLNVGNGPIEWYSIAQAGQAAELEIFHGTHPPAHYFHLNDNNTLSDTLDGTDGFSYDEDMNFYFEGQQSFGICKDNSRLYAKAPPSDCQNFANVTLHSFSQTTG